MTGTGYAFRDTEQAALRLRLLAELWEPASAPFVERWSPAGVELAYDLGCGPGWTTRLLRARAVVGLDQSHTFVEAARQLHPDRRFGVWDVTRGGFPHGPAGLIYCRMLLTHLPDPASALALWAGELRPGGRLLIDEVEAIESSDGVFRRYLELAAELVARRAGRLYVGRLLERAAPAGLEKLDSRAVRLAPDPARVGELFALNLGVWRDSADAPAPQTELDEIAAALPGPHAPITWTMRQIAFGRP